MVKIEDVLKNATDRSAWIDFEGYMNTTMRTDYFDECEAIYLFCTQCGIDDLSLFFLPRSVEVPSVMDL